MSVRSYTQALLFLLLSSSIIVTSSRGQGLRGEWADLGEEIYLSTSEQEVVERYVSASDNDENAFQHIAMIFGVCVLVIVALFVRAMVHIMIHIVARACCGMCMTWCTARCCQGNSSTSSTNALLNLRQDAPTVTVDMEHHQELSQSLLVYEQLPSTPPSSHRDVVKGAPKDVRVP